MKRLTDAMLREPLSTLRVTLFQAALANGEPPSVCPWCNQQTRAAVKDERGLWTWNCVGGCNP